MRCLWYLELFRNIALAYLILNLETVGWSHGKMFRLADAPDFPRCAVAQRYRLTWPHSSVDFQLQSRKPSAEHHSRGKINFKCLFKVIRKHLPWEREWNVSLFPVSAGFTHLQHSNWKTAAMTCLYVGQSCVWRFMLSLDDVQGASKVQFSSNFWHP